MEQGEGVVEQEQGVHIRKERKVGGWVREARWRKRGLGVLRGDAWRGGGSGRASGECRRIGAHPP